MGTGYVRNDTSNNIADGNIINAADLDGEFNAIESAFGTSGHTHDGTSAEGGPITVVGPVQDLVVSATEVKPKTTNTLDLGTSALLYKDAYLQGNMYFRDTALKIVSSADGQLDIDADVELELVAPTVDIDASTALTVDTASTTFTSTLFNVTGSANITGDLDVDNINIDGNTIISTDTNGNIALTPNGTGEVDISKVDIASGEIDGTTIGANSAAAITGTTITGTSFVSSGDMTFGDNDKAIFGAGSDLQIYHDGTDSRIREQGTGGLIVLGNTFVSLRDTSTGGRMLEGTSSGATTAYYNGNPKLATTSTGIDVTGTVTADGLTATGGGSDVVVRIDTEVADKSDWRIRASDSGSEGELYIEDFAGAQWTPAIKFTHGGDISFYEDTGTTAKFFWDASAESLGIGTSSPSGGGNTNLTMNGAVATEFNQQVNGTKTSVYYADANYVVSGSVTSIPYTFRTANTERMRIDSSGNVGIGTASPSQKLSVDSGNIQLSNNYQLRYGTNTQIQGADTYINFTVNNVNPAIRIDSSGNVGIGTSSPQEHLHVSGTGTQRLEVETTQAANSAILKLTSTAGSYGVISDGSDALTFYDYGSLAERMRIDSSGNLLVGKTTTAIGTVGFRVDGANGFATITRDGYEPLILNRKTSDGNIAVFQKDGTTVGSIGVYSTGTRIYLGTGDTGLVFGHDVGTGDTIFPMNPSTNLARDNAIDLGVSGARFDDIHATNGTIQTSDRNEKQDIAELSDAEQRVAVAAKGLLRKFRWKDKVAEKGDKARTHFGIIAQDLQAAFAAEGLDAGDYAMFIHSTWTDEETGEERSRMGVRYSELLAFIIAAI